MPVNNAGEVIPDPGELRREMGRTEDMLRGHLDRVVSNLGEFTQALTAAKAEVAKIGQLSGDLGLDRSRAIDQANRDIERAERALHEAMGQSASAPGRARAAAARAKAKGEDGDDEDEPEPNQDLPAPEPAAQKSSDIKSKR